MKQGFQLKSHLDYPFSWSTHHWLFDSWKKTLQSYTYLMVDVDGIEFLLFDKAT